MLALLVSALLHPLLLSGIRFPRPLADWGGQALEVGLREATPARITLAARPIVAAPTMTPVIVPVTAPATAPTTAPTPSAAIPPVAPPPVLAAPSAALPVAVAPVAMPVPVTAQTAVVATEVGPPVSAPASAGLALRALSQAQGGWRDDAAAEAAPRVRHWRSGQPPQAYALERYIEEWAQKVERIGNLNYPEAARRQRLSGVLRLAVTLDAEGQLLAIAVERPSGQPVLDQAAQRIVELAAPFAAFPPALRAEADRLVISRVWNFSRGDRLASQ